MKRLTKNNLLKLVELKKQYQKTGNKETLKTINTYIEQVINKSNRYFSFLSSCNFNNEQLSYLL